MVKKQPDEHYPNEGARRPAAIHPGEFLAEILGEIV